MKKNKYYLYSDGGARGNPGPAGAGGVIFDERKKKVAEISEYLGILTNNQAEYQALILGLKRAKDLGIKNLACFLDSELVTKQINGLYKVKDQKIKDLFPLVLKLKSSFKEISFSHVKRAKNKEADALVNKALNLYQNQIGNSKAV
ncbi:MAG: ribonuclease HI family protein [Candidatus Thorarchaeota archaeon]